MPAPLATAEILTADGAAITLRRYGNLDGRRIITSHGNGFAVDAYYPFWSLFLDRFDVVVYDYRNHGWNPVGDRRLHNIPRFRSRDNSPAVAGESRGVRRSVPGVSGKAGPRPHDGADHSEEKQPFVNEDEPPMNTNGHED